MDSSLTLEDFDWLRKIEAATDAGRDPPPIPMNIAGKLGAFRFVKSNGLGGFIITDDGRAALLEQDMRDAEDR
jgi:hypothetical protein